MVLKLLIMACGVYMIYWAMQMKTTHKIPEMLVGKGFPIDRAEDPEGFVKNTFPFTMGTGIMLLVAGLVGALEIFILYPMADTVITLVILIVLILYGMFLMKAQRKYLVGIEEKPKKNKK